MIQGLEEELLEVKKSNKEKNEKIHLYEQELKRIRHQNPQDVNCKAKTADISLISPNFSDELPLVDIPMQTKQTKRFDGAMATSSTSNSTTSTSTTTTAMTTVLGNDMVTITINELVMFLHVPGYSTSCVIYPMRKVMNGYEIDDNVFGKRKWVSLRCTNGDLYLNDAHLSSGRMFASNNVKMDGPIIRIQTTINDEAVIDNLAVEFWY
ncbi:uncharacterized protein LOC141914120 [Tubulanus polymorphus]|uniref:uncharacterized protein LOC141914120 n=1 Tax=Tubulanus polymorphus TaxID=672921 RepID=UPI003DA63946